MYKRVDVKKLGRKKSHRELMIQNQVRTLFNNGILKTTTEKAKVVKSVVQSLLSDMEGKEITLATRRKLKKVLGNKKLAEKAIKYAQIEGHGVRVRKVGFRSGDNAELTRVELIGYQGKKKSKVLGKEKEEKEIETQRTKKEQKAKRDVDKRDVKKIVSGKVSKAERKATERARARAGL